MAARRAILPSIYYLCPAWDCLLNKRDEKLEGRRVPVFARALRALRSDALQAVHSACFLSLTLHLYVCQQLYTLYPTSWLAVQDCVRGPK